MTHATALWHRFIPATPVVFVFLWSSAFVGIRFGLPYAEPFTFLAWRFLLAASIFLLVAWQLRSPWPSHLSDYAHIIFCGVLIHGVYRAAQLEQSLGIAHMQRLNQLIIDHQHTLFANIELGPRCNHLAGMGDRFRIR